MACDGSIADEEIRVLSNSKELKDFTQKDIFDEIANLKSEGKLYVKKYIDSLASTDITDSMAINILNIAVEMIKSDNVIEYAEIKFFKLIKNSLKHDNTFVLKHVQGINEDWVEDDFLSYQQAYNKFFSGLNLSSISDIQINSLKL